MHGLRRGDRRARVCGCVTHMKTDDGSGADVRSQPPRDGKFMRSATAEKWGSAPRAPGVGAAPWRLERGGGVRRVGVHTRPRRAAAPARRLAPAPRDACRGTDPRGHVAFIFYSLNHI